MAIERTSSLPDDAHSFGHHHQSGWRRDDTRRRKRERRARDVRLGERQEATQPVVEDEHWVLAFHLDAASPAVDLPPQVPGTLEFNQAALLHSAAKRQQRRIEVRCAGEQKGDTAPGLRRVDQP